MHIKSAKWMLGMVVFVVALCVFVPELAAAEEDINLEWQVAGGGASVSTSTDFVLTATLGQPIAGDATGGPFELGQGFWQDFSTELCCELRADVNHDGRGPDVSDLVVFVAWVFSGGDAPVCEAEVDVNGDGLPIPDISDIVYLVAYMFGGGPAPIECGASATSELATAPSGSSDAVASQ